ncbi:MAG: glycosyltransferase family 1 protein [Spirochaetota bacterium]|nr:MAG: glycosyltransferase family 1 protein [Spirochaetota bacterium]
MRIVFIHHHLRTGGVTRVISQQIRSLGDEVQVLVVVGEPPSHTPPFPFAVVSQIAYDRDRKTRADPKNIADTIVKKTRSHWKGEADLFHIHNPTLGKNRDLITAIKLLQSSGYRLLLQIHDFAEDGRPQNYCDEQYPDDCHYAVLNKRDYAILMRSGLKPEGLHHIPNPVVPPVSEVRQENKKEIVLYPVRAIRRKNIGEAVLLSLFLRNKEGVGVTLEPTGSLDCRSYNDWKVFVKEKNLKVRFGLGIDSTYEEVLGSTRCMITTSIKEGFGYCFLEPWVCQKMLFGRLLKDICDDFTSNGVDLGHLYERIAIPLSLIDKRGFFSMWKQCYRERLLKYGLEANDSKIDGGLQSLTRDGCIDFGILNENNQRKVVDRLLKNKGVREKILDMNPFLIEFTSFKDTEDTIQRNRSVVEEHYSLENCKERLLDIYKKVLDTRIKHGIDKRVVLEAFNTPDMSHLLLCDSAYGKD